MKVGPTGKYPAGKPYFEGDVGHINSGFTIVPPNCIWAFGVLLDEIVLIPESARVVVNAFRNEIKAAFPDAKPTRLKGIFVFSGTDRTIRIDFSSLIDTLTARPGTFLAIADQLQHEIEKIDRWTH